MNERRHPDGQEPRDRIDGLVREWHDWVTAQNARYRKVARSTLAAVAIAIGVGIGDGLIVLGERGEDKIEMAQAIYAGCLYRTESNSAIRRFLDLIGSSAATREEARTSFPVEPDCRTYTEALLDGPIDDEAFRLPALADPRSAPPEQPSLVPTVTPDPSS